MIKGTTFRRFLIVFTPSSTLLYKYLSHNKPTKIGLRFSVLSKLSSACLLFLFHHNTFLDIICVRQLIIKERALSARYEQNLKRFPKIFFIIILAPIDTANPLYASAMWNHIPMLSYTFFCSCDRLFSGWII